MCRIIKIKKVMKARYFIGACLLLMGFVTTSCNSDDDYSIQTASIITEITTGEASVTAISATTYGTVKDLSSMASSRYQVGTVYSTTADPTKGGTRQSGTIDENGNVTASLTGLTKGATYYYATYVTLQNALTKYGEVKSFIATDAQVATAAATDISACSATLKGQTQGISDILKDAVVGFKYATSEADVETGVDLPMDEASANFEFDADGLLPATTYYYKAYVKLGDGLYFGDAQQFTTEAQEMEYVDLGLSVLWAKYNIGAESEIEPGIQVGFGDQSFYNFSEDPNQYTPWSITATDEDFIYNLSIDGDSPMKSYIPSAAQMEELIKNTVQENEIVEGVPGIRFTAANGNSIFLPMAGYRKGREVTADGAGYYWTSVVGDVNPEYAKSMKLATTVSMEMSSLAYGLNLRSVRPYAVITPVAGKVKVGDLENNGRIRIELYNEYGSTKADPCVQPNSIKFKQNMVVTFSIAGIDGNMKEGAPAYHVAGLEYSDPTWAAGSSYWSGLSMGKYEAAVTGDGTYTVWCEVAEGANGAIVFCVDIKDLAADAIDPTKITAEVLSIKLDADVNEPVNSSFVEFQNKDGNNTDGRIEIYNEYGKGGSTAQGYYNGMNFNGMCYVDFTIKGIDGNLVSGATGSYKTEMSYAAASWSPSYWGGADYGSATVTGDGSYQVYTYLNSDCSGAVVWTIELYGLWKDLVDTSKIQVSVDKITIPGKK